MFSFRKSVIAAMAVGMIFTFGACKRDVSGVTAQGVTSSWKVDDVNSLLEYVPADAPIVVATTRNFNIDSPEIKSFLEKALVYQEKTMAQLNTVQDPDAKQMVDAAKKAMESYAALLKDYKNEAVNWGLEPSGRQDSVTYISKTHIVGHATVVDADKLKGKLQALLDGYLSMGESKLFKSKTIGSDDNAWTLYQPDQMPGAELSLPSFVLRFHKNLVTFVVVQGEPDVNTLADLVKPVAKGLSKDALGKIGKDAAAVGFADNANLVDLLQIPAVKAILNAADIELDDACVPEFKALAANFPRIHFVERLLKDGVMLADSTLVFSDKAELKKLQALHAGSVDLKSAKTLANLSINLQLDKAIPYLSDLSKAVAAKNFKCGMLSDFSRQLSSLPKMASDPDVTKYASAVSSIGVIVDDFNMETKKVDASLMISGDKLGELVPEISQMLSAMSMPVDIKKDEVTKFDLEPMIGWPVSLDMTYGNTDFAMATTGHDVKAMTKLSKTTSTDFVQLGLALKLFSTFIMTEADGLPLDDGHYGISFGTNDDGLRLTFSFKM